MTNQSTYYRVNELRSERACTREKLEEKTISRHIGDYPTMDEAVDQFNKIGGMEVAAQILFICEEKNACLEIICNY
jgi:hypothetical protein